MITPKAKARLAVLQRYSDLGSGFKIAAHDLEIRGAGNLLGAEQSGHIAAVGYELYLRLMEEAISEVKGETVRAAPEPELNLRLSGAIPESYMPETQMRLTLYKRFASVQDEEELEALAEETRDRFGVLPCEVQNLLTVIRVKMLAKRGWIRAVSLQEKRVLFTFDPSSPVNIDSLMGMVAKEPERFYWVKPHELAMGFKEGKEGKAIESAIQFLLRLEIA
jgi:transcription-repair coupling factor (superfamily II helicase)